RSICPCLAIGLLNMTPRSCMLTKGVIYLYGCERNAIAPQLEGLAQEGYCLRCVPPKSMEPCQISEIRPEWDSLLLGDSKGCLQRLFGQCKVPVVNGYFSE